MKYLKHCENFHDKIDGASLLVYEFASLRVCEFANLRVCGFASLRVCEFASLRVCEFTNTSLWNLLWKPLLLLILIVDLA